MIIDGETRGLAPSQIREAERLFKREVASDEVVSLALAREIAAVAKSLSRRVGVLITREGKVERVILGTREILYLPDLGRYRLGKGRLRRLRLIFSDLSKEGTQAVIPSDIYTDLEKLRLDAVVAVRERGNDVALAVSHLVGESDPEKPPYVTEYFERYHPSKLHFLELIDSVEDQLDDLLSRVHAVPGGAVIVGIYPKSRTDWQDSLVELQELARTAGVAIVDTIIQRRDPDPRTLVGKGKLEEIVLRCLRLGAELLIFDCELKPSQWRVITNATELKVLDRSMLILDIFSQRAKSSDGRLQVELAQLKYNLPRLVEQDVGLSRLTGGIGGRGPGETKLEISRRRARDRIRELENKIEKLRNQRELRRKKRKGVPIPLIAILGYTNAGKSTLFNALTQSHELAEDKLFATLEPSQGRYVLPPTPHEQELGSYGTPVVFTDTVGFIRDLPAELKNAFRATLEELYEANLLLHVVDASSPFAFEHIRSVEKVLQEMELTGVPKVMVWNKIDAVSTEALQSLLAQHPGVGVSAERRLGFDGLVSAIRSKIDVGRTVPVKDSEQNFGELGLLEE